MDLQNTKEGLAEFLSGIPLFKNASGKVLQLLSGKIKMLLVAPGHTVIHKGEMGDSMYIILSGKLKVHDGEHQVALLGPGQFFGELSLLDSEPRSMSVSAIEPSKLGSIARHEFYDVLESHPQLIRDVIAELNHRLRRQNDVLISEYRMREERLTLLVKKRTLELEEKNNELNRAMENLRKSQQQLVQSEKLASLGAMIAGIAHEIQNPLNFVNNFSQLSAELIDEIRESSTENDQAEILDDLKVNLEKIHHHGMRAGSIVKNMLEHSRKGSSEKQETDLNKLAEEYLNLSYHSMRAKSAMFNCKLISKPDSSLPLVKAVTQDLGRVLLNLFNNAFYSLNEKALQQKENYQPVAGYETSLENDSIVIRVFDNGMGVDDQIAEKIFEPFFTTKPSGQGTGLGLSLSHDIISAHGGTLTLSKENDLTLFKITLPRGD